ncbi:unnamed protein product [Ectocarpus fasciculatus]
MDPSRASALPTTYRPDIHFPPRNVKLSLMMSRAYFSAQTSVPHCCSILPVSGHTEKERLTMLLILRHPHSNPLLRSRFIATCSFKANPPPLDISDNASIRSPQCFRLNPTLALYSPPFRPAATHIYLRVCMKP